MSPSDDELVGELSRTRLFRDYERAFVLATGLPLVLRPPVTWTLVQRGRRKGNPFCALLAQSNKGCSVCLETQEKIADPRAEGGVSATCFAGFRDTAAPVRIGQRLVGFLQTGQVALRPPTTAKFRQIARKVAGWGNGVDLKHLEKAYFQSRVMAPKQYAGVVLLLEIFAAHLGEVGNQLLIQESCAEPPLCRRAKAYVADHQGDPISLGEMAHALHVSTFYFCKIFKKATGLTFTNYLARVRIERAKALLLDPNRRVSEVAYEVGFGSLTHFNRLFRKLVGCSPSGYRDGVSPSAAMTRQGTLSPKSAKQLPRSGVIL